MPLQDAHALLGEALDLLNDHPRFSLRRNRQRNSYDLAARIETYLASSQEETHPAIAVARDRWASSGFLRVDADEQVIELGEDQACWVRAWVRVDATGLGEIDPALATRYRQAVSALPEMTRAILRAHQQDGQNITQVAQRFGIATREVERHIGEALAAISKAIGYG